MAVRVKICGITRAEDAQAAVRLGASAIGFVFWERSPRYISPDKAREIVSMLPAFVTAVGVYVDPDRDWVIKTSSRSGLNLLQFHGDESSDFCGQFSLPYIKAVRVKEGVDLIQYAARHSSAKGLLLDTFVEGAPGGTGQEFDWALVPRDLRLPLILSGGLRAENVARAISQVQPWAVDVSSGVETSRGIKDANKIAAFMRGVRASESL